MQRHLTPRGICGKSNLVNSILVHHRGISTWLPRAAMAPEASPAADGSPRGAAKLQACVPSVNPDMYEPQLTAKVERLNSLLSDLNPPAAEVFR